MKSFVLSVLVLFFWSFRLFGQESSCAEGTQAELTRLDWIAHTLKTEGLAYKTLSYDNLPGAHSFAHSLVVNFPGRQAARLVIVIPVDTARQQDALVSLQAALAAARAWKTHTPAFPVTLFFAGAERSKAPGYPLSSSQFLNTFFPWEPTSVVILDIDSQSTQLELSLVSGASIAPLWLTEAWLETLRSAGFHVHIAGNQPQIFRFDLPEKRTLAEPWFERGFPTMLIRSVGSPTAGTGTVPLITLAINSFMNRFPAGYPPTSDHSYIIFDGFGKTIFLTQEWYLTLLLVLGGLITLLFLARHKRRGVDTVSWLKAVWQIPVTFFFLFLLLTFSTGILDALFQQKGFSSFWRYEPFLTLSLKIILTLSLYFLSFFQVRRNPLSRWSKFYSYSALFVLSFETLAAAAVELSFSFYFLWAFFFAVLFHLTPKKWLKAIFFALAPLWFVKALVATFALAPDAILQRWILVTPALGNLVVALVLFPFLQMAHALHYLSHQRQNRNEKLRVRLLFLATAAASLILIAVVLHANPFQNQKIPLTAQEQLNISHQTDNLTISAPVSWGKATFWWNGQVLNLPPQAQTAHYNLPFKGGLWKTTVSSEHFLNRKVWHLHLETGGPRQLTVTLTSAHPLVVYDCNFPFSLEQGGKVVQVFIGQNPPPELDLSLTLAQDVLVTVHLSALYQPAPRKVHVEGAPLHVESELTVHDTLVLSS